MNLKNDSHRTHLAQLAMPTTLLFFSGAWIGWIYEVILHLFSTGMFVNRGMLHGPWLPIYGVGCVLIVALKKAVGNHPFRFFLISVGACAVLEYASSWLMELIYHARWWDYSDLPMNLNGRIFAGGLLGFGLAGCVFSYFLLPALEASFRKLSVRRRNMIVTVLVAVFVLDGIVSLLFPNAGLGITS